MPLSNPPFTEPAPLAENARSGQIFGFMNVAATGTQVVRLTPYVEPTAGARRSITASVNDSVAGIGARKIRIIYFDSAMNGPFVEDVIPNGVTPVDTVATNIHYIEDISVVEAGSLGANGGTITLKSATGGGGTTIGTIVWYFIGIIQSFWCHHYVPVGRQAFVSNIVAGLSAGAASSIYLRAVNPTSAVKVITQRTPTYRILAANESRSHMLTPHAIVTGPARIDLMIAPDAATAGTIHAGFGYYEQ